jgi:hypothetical protein
MIVIFQPFGVAAVVLGTRRPDHRLASLDR